MCIRICVYMYMCMYMCMYMYMYMYVCIYIHIKSREKKRRTDHNLCSNITRCRRAPGAEDRRAAGAGRRRRRPRLRAARPRAATQNSSRPIILSNENSFAEVLDCWTNSVLTGKGEMDDAIRMDHALAPPAFRVYN